MRRVLLVTTVVAGLVASSIAIGHAVGGTGTVEPPPRIAFLANGVNPADALAAGGIAGQLGAPLFTTRPASLDAAAEAGLVGYAPELVIVLGGPGALSDEVVAAVAEATGLAVRDPGTPEDGVVRAAGADRFATAAVVAGLLQAYAPAYLPVDATALGAVDADTLDGLDSTAFVRAGIGCASGETATGIDADGQMACQGPPEEILVSVPRGARIVTGSLDQGATDGADTYTGASGTIRVPIDVVDRAAPFAAAEVIGVRMCVLSGGVAVTSFAIEHRDVTDGAARPVGSVDGIPPVDGACTLLSPPHRLVIDRTSRTHANISLTNASIAISRIDVVIRPTDDSATVELP